MYLSSTPQIIVASQDRFIRLYLENLLAGVGYVVLSTDSFQPAKTWSLSEAPGLLIADVRLGDFNGLHLGWLRHFRYPNRPTVIVHSLFDPMLEIEASKFGAPYIVVPAQERRLLHVTEDALQTPVRPDRTEETLISRQAVMAKRRQSAQLRLRH